MQCLFKGHQTTEHCPCIGAVVICSAPRPFVAVFSVRSHQECPCIRAKCTHKRYTSSRQCDIDALNMVQEVFHRGAITIRRSLIVLLVHTTPYASSMALSPSEQVLSLHNHIHVITSWQRALQALYLDASPLYRPSNNRALPLYRCWGYMKRTKAVCSRFQCQKGEKRMNIAYNLTAGQDRGQRKCSGCQVCLVTQPHMLSSCPP